MHDVLGARAAHDAAIKAGDGRPVLVLRSERGPAESEISYGVIAVDFEQALISDRLDQTFRDNYPDSP